MMDYSALVTELKTLLSVEGITTSLTDEDYTVLLKHKLNYILSIVGLNSTEPSTYTDTLLDYDGNRHVLLHHYPVIELQSVQIDNRTINTNEYNLNKNSGVIKFTSRRQDGILTIQYTAGLTDSQISTILEPLLLDWVVYDANPENTGVISSIKEGDVSVNYDTTNSELIQLTNRLNDFKKEINGVRGVML